jgi:hypothetical protein
MSIDLKAYLEGLKNQPNGDDVYEFPCDYQDTYDLGIKHGKVQMAQELWKLLGFDIQ